MSNSEEYSKIFVKIFSINKSKLKKLKYQSVSQWDSVGHMSMISSLEETFKITMDIDDIVDFSSYEKGKKILKKYKIKI
jgi:acyl carrier protein|tara:strand:- start:2599 stop:2835 length:237 start_codon:yes stop_codon:yes gene_type:complete